MPARGGADDGVDMQASRGLIALLVATVVFFALWIVALKPGSSTSGGSPTQGLSGYRADIAKAHQAVQVSAADNARSGGQANTSSTPATAATPAPATSTIASQVAGRTRASHHAVVRRSAAQAKPAHRATAASRFGEVQRALRAHKALAMLFYNPAAADDRAVRQELAAVPTHRGRVVKLTIPLSEIAHYTAVTEQVPVNFSPTLVLIAPNGQAREIVGFSDQFEIAQRVDDALAAK